MNLSYTKEIVERRQEEVQLRTPERWGMFSTKGNKRLTTLANRLTKSIDESTSIRDQMKIFATFFQEYRKMSNFDSYSEASDTAVRESVWGFAFEVAHCVDFSTDILDEIWVDPKSFT